MVSKVLVTSLCVLFSLGAFVFGGPVEPGPLNPFGILFLGIAVLVWRQWVVISGNFSPALWDGFGRGLMRRDDDDSQRD